MPNLGKHGIESARDKLVSHFIYECLVLALDVRWVGRVVVYRERDTVRELRNASLDKTVDVKRNSSNCDCFVTARGLSGEASTFREAATLTCSCLA